MRATRALALLPVLLLSLPLTLAQVLTRLVNPLIATRGGGGFGGWGSPNVNPGPMSPFPGMRLGPDTTRLGLIDNYTETWSKLNRKGGYFGSDNAARAFSHTHTQGAGESDYGNHGIMIFRNSNLSAAVAMVPFEIFDYLFYDYSPFATWLDKSSEIARLGYYAISLPSAQTAVELTVSGPMAGLHRYTCSQQLPGSASTPNTGPCVLTLNVCHNTHTGGCPSGAVGIAFNATTQQWAIEATVNNTGDFSERKGVAVYLVGLVSATSASGKTPVNASASGVWSGRQLLPPGIRNATARSDSLGAFISFSAPGSQSGPDGDVSILVRVALSWTSTADAWANLVAEQYTAAAATVDAAKNTAAAADTAKGDVLLQTVRDGGVPASAWAEFDAAAADTEAEWEVLLSSVTINSGGASAHNADNTGEHLSFPSPPWAPHSQRDIDDGMAQWRSALRAFLGTPEGFVWAAEFGFVPLPSREHVQALVTRIALAGQGGSSDGGDNYEAGGDNYEPIGSATVGTALFNAPSMTDDALIERIELELTATRDAAADGFVDHTGAADLAIFYTALFRVFCAPSTYNNADGTYKGMDDSVHGLSADDVFLSDLSLWDVYRTQMPLFSVLLPDAIANVTASLLLMKQQGGHVPKWPFANDYTGTMVAEHGLEVMFDCVVKGACARLNTSSIVATAYAAIATQESLNVSNYTRLGFVPWPEEGLGSYTLEYAQNDATVAALAQWIGDNATAALYQGRAQNFRNAWVPKNYSAFYPRHGNNGSFFTDADLYLGYPENKYYTEGDGAHWRFAVPHDIPGLISLFPTADAFVSALQVLCANQTLWFGGNGLGTILPNIYLWNGNEITLMHAWIFPYAGNDVAWRTQYWVRWLLRTYYDATVDGLPGNDDYSTMSAWGVWSYLGLYPVAGTDTYILGAPVFSNVTLRIPSFRLRAVGGASSRRSRATAGGDAAGAAGPTLILNAGTAAAAPAPRLTVIAHNSSAANIYAYTAAVNGVFLDTPFVTHGVLFPSGGGGAALLEFWMCERPAVWQAQHDDGPVFFEFET